MDMLFWTFCLLLGVKQRLRRLRLCVEAHIPAVRGWDDCKYIGAGLYCGRRSRHRAAAGGQGQNVHQWPVRSFATMARSPGRGLASGDRAAKEIKRA